MTTFIRAAAYLLYTSLFLYIPTLPAAESRPLTIIQNEDLRVGILMKAGGRIVSLHHQESPNLILADEDMWSQPAWTEITITPYRWGVYPMYKGHSVWLGPQSQWYKQQTIYDYMTDKSWPPDKHLNLTDYTIIAQSPDALTLQSPDSPVSGMRLIKTYRLEGNKLHIEVEAINIADREHQWTLWSLTRIAGNSSVWIHPGKQQRYHYNDKHTGTLMKMLPYKEWMHLDNSPLNKDECRAGKFFSDCITPVIIAFTQGHALEISFDKVDTQELPEDHSNIEIFHVYSQEPGKSMIELEHHGKYTRLKPGEKMIKRETWTINRVSELRSPDEEYQYTQQH